MPLTPEERQEIVQEIIAELTKRFENLLPIWTEKVYLGLPELIGNLMTHHAALLDLNKTFYAANKDFAAHKPIVQAVVEQLEGKNPTMEYKDILRDAVPIIRERIAIQAGLDMTTVKRPDRHLPGLMVAAGARDPEHPHGSL